MERVCVNFAELYKKREPNLYYGGYIDFLDDENAEYYDLKLDNGELVACDGEAFDIIYEDKIRTRLQNVEAGKTFYMTKVEADIAIFRF